MTYISRNLMLFIGVLATASALAANPAWWTEPDTKIIGASASNELLKNYAPLNIGQLMNVAVLKFSSSSITIQAQQVRR